MLKKLLFYTIGILILFACSRNEELNGNSSRVNVKPFAFNLQLLYTDDGNMSFPLWFNDTIIANERIKTLTRRISHNGESATDSILDLEKKIIYAFNTKGEILSVRTLSYYEHVLFSDVTFEYNGIKDKNGFAIARILKTELIEEEESLSGMGLYVQKEANERFLVYKNKQSGMYKAYITDSNYWGTVSVDTILGPQPEDIIVYGTPSRPIKSYQVKNTVEESNVKSYSYYGDTDILEKATYDEYPFTMRRSINYSPQGQCYGFVDSIFTDDKYLSRKSYVFDINKNGLPEKLIYKKELLNGKSTNLQQETYEYEFYLD